MTLTEYAEKFIGKPYIWGGRGGDGFDCSGLVTHVLNTVVSKDMLKNVNWWLVGAFFVTTALTLAAIYVPGLCTVFGIEPGTFQTNELLISVALVPAASSTRPTAWPEPTANARKCIKAAQDIESGKVAAKGYTDMDEMMRDLLA